MHLRYLAFGEFVVLPGFFKMDLWVRDPWMEKSGNEKTVEAK